MRLSFILLLVIAVNSRADDTEDATNREVDSVDFFDQRDHDMVVNRAFGPDAYNENPETDHSNLEEAADESSWKLQVPFHLYPSYSPSSSSPQQRYIKSGRHVKHSIQRRSAGQNSRRNYFDASRTRVTRVSHVPNSPSGAIVQSAVRYSPSRGETPTPVNLPFPAGRAGSIGGGAAASGAAGGGGGGGVQSSVQQVDNGRSSFESDSGASDFFKEHMNEPSDKQEETASAAEPPRFEFNYDIPKDSFRREVVDGHFSTFAKLPNNFESLIQSDNSFLDTLSEYPSHHTDSESRHNESVVNYEDRFSHYSSANRPSSYSDYDYEPTHRTSSSNDKSSSSSGSGSSSSPSSSSMHQYTPRSTVQQPPSQSSRLSPHFLPLHQYQRSNRQFMRRSGNNDRYSDLDDDDFAEERKESGAWSQYWPTTTTTTTTTTPPPPPPQPSNKEIVAHVRVMKNGVVDQNVRRHGEILVRYNAEPVAPPAAAAAPPPASPYPTTTTTPPPPPPPFYQPYPTTTTTTTPPPPPPPYYQVIYPAAPKTTTTTTTTPPPPAAVPMYVPWSQVLPSPPSPTPASPYDTTTTTTPSPAASIYGNLPPSQLPKVIYAIMMMDKMQAAASGNSFSSKDGTKNPVLFLT